MHLCSWGMLFSGISCDVFIWLNSWTVNAACLDGVCLPSCCLGACVELVLLLDMSALQHWEHLGLKFIFHKAFICKFNFTDRHRQDRHKAYQLLFAALDELAHFIWVVELVHKFSPHPICLWGLWSVWWCPPSLLDTDNLCHLSFLWSGSLAAQVPTGFKTASSEQPGFFCHCPSCSSS